MPNVYQMAITGLPNVAATIKSYRSDPMLGGEWSTPYPNWDSGASLAQNINVGAGKGLVNSVTGQSVVNGGIRIKADTCREKCASDISSQMIVTPGGSKVWETDNIAPMPRIWSITGYVMAEFYELSALFGFTILAKKKKLLALRDKREALLFKTVDNEVVRVGISDITFTPSADAANCLPIELELREMPILTATESSLSPDTLGSSPVAGTSPGGSISLGSGSVAQSASSLPTADSAGRLTGLKTGALV
jgi:hypothetical protein